MLKAEELPLLGPGCSLTQSGLQGTKQFPSTYLHLQFKGKELAEHMNENMYSVGSLPLFKILMVENLITGKILKKTNTLN